MAVLPPHRLATPTRPTPTAITPIEQLVNSTGDLIATWAGERFDLAYTIANLAEKQQRHDSAESSTDHQRRDASAETSAGTMS
jgi:hypothetical protein